MSQPMYDPTKRLGRAAQIERSIAAKRAHMPQTDANGRPILGTGARQTYNDEGDLLSVEREKPRKKRNP